MGTQASMQKGNTRASPPTPSFSMISLVFLLGSWVFYHCPIVFLRFSSVFPWVALYFLWSSIGFPIVFVGIHVYSKVLLWFSDDDLIVSIGIRMDSLKCWFPLCIPMYS